jgi:putative membrane protein insertion efficiency factor
MTSKPKPVDSLTPPATLLNRLAAAMILGIVAVYRVTLGWVMGGHCRHYPTCSQYMLDAVAKYGPWRGGWRGIKRICRCHPFGTSGYDPA